MPCNCNCNNCTEIEFHQKSFRIKHDYDDKFFTRLLSMESSRTSPPSTVYYGDVSIAVPFLWETRPGTPKHTFSGNNPNIPQIIPPTHNYEDDDDTNYYNFKKYSSSSSSSSKSKFLLETLLRRMNPKKKLCQSLSASPLSSRSCSSSSSNSSSSDQNVTPKYAQRFKRFSSWGSSCVDKARNNEVCNSRMSFGNNGARVRVGYSMCKVKKALLSVVGRGPVDSKLPFKDAPIISTQPLDVYEGVKGEPHPCTSKGWVGNSGCYP